MTPRIKNKARLRELPWPIDLPILRGDKLCHHTEPKAGKASLWDWLNRTFDVTNATGRELQTQFLYILMDVIDESVDVRDKGNVCPSDVPSGVSKTTKAPYSGDEVAAWWNEAVARLRSLL